MAIPLSAGELRGVPFDLGRKSDRALRDCAARGERLLVGFARNYVVRRDGSRRGSVDIRDPEVSAREDYLLTG